ncbi:MAG TPA: hypothetical protein VG939_05235 [Caulobacteraceae bacterium]|nr:hypothetical protein [Caulobacteraceae bacterium]
MSASHLVVIPNTPQDDAPVEPLSQRIRRLQAEARSMAREHVEQLRSALAEVARLSTEIAEGGDAYPVGAREMSRRLQEEAASQAMSLAAINERALN